MNDLKNKSEDVVHLPKDAEMMLDFIQAGITAAVQKGLEPKAIIETFHDYTCWWLMVMDQQEAEGNTTQYNKETDKRLS